MRGNLPWAMDVPKKSRPKGAALQKSRTGGELLMGRRLEESPFQKMLTQAPRNIGKESKTTRQSERRASEFLAKVVFWKSLI